MKRTIALMLALMMMVPLAGSVTAQDGGDREVITTDNISALELLIRVGRGDAKDAAWSADGSMILVNGTLGVWKYSADALDTDMEPELMDVGDIVSLMAAHPTEPIVAIETRSESRVDFYDTTTNEMLSSVELENSPNSLEYSADGSQVIMSYGSRGMGVIDTATGALTDVQVSLNNDAPAILSLDGSTIVAANSSNNVLVWTDPTAEPMMLEGHTDRIRSLAISPDGTLLVSGGNDDKFIVWDLASGNLLQEFLQPEDDFSNADVAAMAFTPDGSTLITGHGGKVRFWDVAARAMSGEAETGASVTSIDVSPDGSQFIVRTSTNEMAVQLYNIDGTPVATTTYHNGTLYAADFSPDSAVMAFSDSDRFLYMWDTATAGEINTAIKIEDGATTGIGNLENISFSSDNAVLATLQSFSVTLRDPVTGAAIFELEDVDGISEDVDFSPDNSMIAVVTSQGLYVFDVATGQRIAQFLDSNDWLNDVTWSPDQTMLVTVSGDNSVRVYTIGG